MERNLFENMFVREYVNENNEIERIKEDDDWLELWHDYADLSIEAKEECCFENIFLGETTICKTILSNLRKLEKKDPELLACVLDVRLACQILREVSFIEENYSNCSKYLTEIIIWVQKNLNTSVTQEDFWENLKRWAENKMYLRLYHLHGFVAFLKLWKVCFKKNIDVDAKDVFQKELILHLVEEALNEDILFFEKNPKDNVMSVLCLFDSFNGFKRSISPNILENMIRECSKEVICLALQKNFLPVEIMKTAIEHAMTEERFELIPLFLLKKYGEWPAKISA